MKVATKISDELAPLRERRRHYESHPSEVTEILLDGEGRARSTAVETMNAVHAAMNLG
jgi:tryptophanyl-tRNA synthetase